MLQLLHDDMLGASVSTPSCVVVGGLDGARDAKDTPRY